MFPPCTGRETSTGLGTTRRDTSPIPMRLPASNRSASIFFSIALSASSSCGVSRPVFPNASAAMIITGIAMSTQLASIPSMRSRLFPVGTGALALRPADDRDLARQGIGSPDAVDLQRMRRAHDAEQDCVAPPGIRRQVRGEEIRTPRGAAAHEHTRYLALARHLVCGALVPGIGANMAMFTESSLRSSL